MLAFLRAWALLVLSASLAGLILIGSDTRIAPPYGIDDWQTFMLTQALVSALLAGVVLAVPAALRQFARRRLTKQLALRLPVDLALATVWLLVVGEMTYEHRINCGNTWTRIEFFNFYMLTSRAILLSAVLLAAAWAIDNRWSRHSDR